MKTKLFLALLFLAGPALAILPPPPASVDEVTAGTDRYKYVTSYSLRQAGISSPTNGITAEVAEAIAIGSDASGTNSFAGDGGGLTNVTAATATRATNAPDGKTIISRESALTNRVSYFGGSVAIATNREPYWQGSFATGFQLYDTLANPLLLVDPKVPNAGGYGYYWGSATNQYHAFQVSETPHDGNEPRIVFNFLSEDTLELSRQWGFRTNSLTYRISDITYDELILVDESQNFTFGGTNQNTYRGGSNSIVIDNNAISATTGTNSLTIASNRVAIDGDVYRNADTYYGSATDNTGGFYFWDSLNELYRGLTYTPGDETFDLNAALRMNGSAVLQLGSYYGNGSGITNLPVAGIDATGTPSGTTYLRGDGAWATPAGGSGDSYIFTNAAAGGLRFTNEFGLGAFVTGGTASFLTATGLVTTVSAANTAVYGSQYISYAGVNGIDLATGFTLLDTGGSPAIQPQSRVLNGNWNAQGNLDVDGDLNVDGTMTVTDLVVTNFYTGITNATGLGTDADGKLISVPNGPSIVGAIISGANINSGAPRYVTPAAATYSSTTESSAAIPCVGGTWSNLNFKVVATLQTGTNFTVTLWTNGVASHLAGTVVGSGTGIYSASNYTASVYVTNNTPISFAVTTTSGSSVAPTVLITAAVATR
jgi:hypothetical protein